MSRDAFLVAVGIMVSCAWIGPAQALGSVESGAPGGERIFFQEIPSVHGASKYEQKVSEAPASVTIVTADDIRRFGWRTIADALRSVKGFYTTYDRAYTYAGVRGFGRPGTSTLESFSLSTGIGSTTTLTIRRSSATGESSTSKLSSG